MKGEAWEVAAWLAAGCVVIHIHDEGDKLVAIVRRWMFEVADPYVPMLEFRRERKGIGYEEVRSFATEVAVEFWGVKEQY